MIEVLDQTTPDAAVILAQHAVSMRRLLPGRLAKRGNGKAPSLPSDISRRRFSSVSLRRWANCKAPRALPPSVRAFNVKP